MASVCGDDDFSCKRDASFPPASSSEGSSHSSEGSSHGFWNMTSIPAELSRILLGATQSRASEVTTDLMHICSMTIGYTQNARITPANIQRMPSASANPITRHTITDTTGIHIHRPAIRPNARRRYAEGGVAKTPVSGSPGGLQPSANGRARPSADETRPASLYRPVDNANGQSSLCMTSPERSFGSNQVVFGGMILPESAISISCFIDTG